MSYEEFKASYPLATYADYVRAECSPAYVSPDSLWGGGHE
jgi:hypothetical protein